MKITVLDAATLGNDMPLYKFEALGDVTVYQTTDASQAPGRINGSDVIITNKVKINSSALNVPLPPKLVCVSATGYDNIDIEYCKNHGIGVCNVKGYSTASVAQVTVATVLELVCKLREYNKYVVDGSYTESGIANRLVPPYREINGMVWGIIGLGNIGRQVGRIANALGCSVIANKRTPDDEFECVSLNELCSRSDIISVHIPLSDTTRGIISRELISEMKDGVVFVNTARGAVTDESALADAVISGHLGALGCDVFSEEPFGKEHPFYAIKSLPNVCLTPHMAWGSVDSRIRLTEEMVLNIKAFFAGDIRNRIC